jgi:hypothetical protein
MHLYPKNELNLDRPQNLSAREMLGHRVTVSSSRPKKLEYCFKMHIDQAERAKIDLGIHKGRHERD